MAQKIIFTDDHDGSQLTDPNPVTIKVGDTQWQADLSPDNQQKLTDWIAGFLPEVQPTVTKATGRRTRTPATRAKIATVSAEERTAQRTRIATWVDSLPDTEKSKFPEDTRWTIGGRGRIDHAIVRAFYEAHPDEERLFTVSG